LPPPLLPPTSGGGATGENYDKSHNLILVTVVVDSKNTLDGGRSYFMKIADPLFDPLYR